jgi:hypothetical protein
MPINLRYPTLPSFLVNGINYNTCGNIRKPLPYTGETGLSPNGTFESYAPFIEARFSTSKSKKRGTKKRQDQFDASSITYYITTGNFLGTDRDKRAFIKSASMGISQSYGATLEIIDTSGQDFTSFYNSVYKAVCQTQTSKRPNNRKNTDFINVALNFGYVFVNKDGTNAIYQQSFANTAGLSGKRFGPYINYILTKIDVTFDNNIWRYKLELKGPDGQASQGRVPKTQGKLDQKVPIIRGFEKMLDGTCPPKPTNNTSKEGDQVVLVKSPQGTNGDWSYTTQKNANTPMGRTGVYPGYNLPPLDAIQKNLNTFVTSETKGVYLSYPSGQNDDTLYLIEAEDPECVRDRQLYKKCSIALFMGTYVVNGGDLSPVISFSPKIEFTGIPNKQTGGTTAGSNSSNSAKPRSGCRNSSTNKDPQDTPGATIASKNSVDSKVRTIVPPSQAAGVVQEAADAQLGAELKSKPVLGAVTADLTIQGDPRFVWSLNVIGSFIKIIFINPFTVIQNPVFGKNNTSNAEWLSLPTINDQLSSIAYIITGCDHEISDGKWITKLKIKGIEENRRR